MTETSKSSGGTGAPKGADFAVVGAGILGLAVARELLARHPGASLTVLEREPVVAWHQTGHNSGVIHAGIYYPPGSLKARYCVDGARALYAYCDERGIPARRTGKLIVATREDELPRLEELHRRANANGSPGVERVDAAGLREHEPEIAGIAGLWSPGTGEVDFAAVARAYGEDVERAGGRVVTGFAVERVDERGDGLALAGPQSTVTAGRAVFCAGLWADRMAVLAGGSPDPRIVPFRGGYMRLKRPAADRVRTMVYPVPDPELPFLGVHLTRHGPDEVLVGPTALMAGARDAYSLRTLRWRDVGSTLTWPGTWRMARTWWRTGLAEIRRITRAAVAREASRFLPGLTAADLEPGPAGVRAQALSRDGRLLDDFAFSDTHRALHVRNAPSPAATASLALARAICDRLEQATG